VAYFWEESFSIINGVFVNNNDGPSTSSDNQGRRYVTYCTESLDEMNDILLGIILGISHAKPEGQEPRKRSMMVEWRMKPEVRSHDKEIVWCRCTIYQVPSDVYVDASGGCE